MSTSQPETESTQTLTENPVLPHYPTHKRSKQAWLKWFIPVAVLLLIIVAGGVYLHLHHGGASKHNSSTNHAVRPSTNSSAQNATSQYVSNGQDLNLSFSYPANWSVTPPTNDNTSDQPIAVTSPLMTIDNASGKSVTGKAIVTIRPGTAQISELASGNATAGQVSVQIGYTQPLASQQQYQYLSFINLSGGTDTSGAFQEVFITGQQQFSQGQNITAADLSSLDPIISASFYSCSTQECISSGETPLSITMNTWQNSAPFTQVLALIQTLQLH